MADGDGVARESLQNLLCCVRGAVCSRARPLVSTLPRGDVVEIQGPAASGKTHLLYHWVLLCIAPSTDSGRDPVAAVVYDTDASFDVRRLHRLLLTRVSAAAPADDSARRVAHHALHRLHVFRPSSLLQLATSLLHLPSYHARHIPDHDIGLVAVDSISAFYWQDRFAADQMRSMPRLSQPPVPAMAHPLQHVLTALGQLRLSHAPFIALTNWGLTLASRSSGPVAFYKQHLHPFPPYSENNDSPVSSRTDLPPPHVPLLLTHHITLSARSMPPELSDPSTAHNEQIIVFVRTTGSRDSARFTFCITPENVHLSDALDA